MLSDRERRVLEQTAQELTENDPRLSQQLTGHWRRATPLAATLTIGLAVLAGAITVGLLALGLIGNAALFAATSALLVLGLRRRHRPPLSPRQAPPTDTPSDSGGDNADPDAATGA